MIVEYGRSLDDRVKQHVATVLLMHLEFVESSKRYTGAIVPQGGDECVVMELIVSRPQALLSE